MSFRLNICNSCAMHEVGKTFPSLLVPSTQHLSLTGGIQRANFKSWAVEIGRGCWPQFLPPPMHAVSLEYSVFFSELKNSYFDEIFKNLNLENSIAIQKNSFSLKFSLLVNLGWLSFYFKQRTWGPTRCQVFHSTHAAKDVSGIICTLQSCSLLGTCNWRPTYRILLAWDCNPKVVLLSHF